MFSIAPARLAGLRTDERGSVAMIFALCLFVLVMMLGLAIDIGRAIHTKTKLSAALDAAALAAGKSMFEKEMSTSELAALAKHFFEANLGRDGTPNFGKVTAFMATIDRQTSTVTVSATADVPTLFARVGGINSIKLPTTAAAAFDPKDIELSLSLDVTGSMCSPCTKIDDLQAAARDLVDILLPRDKSTTNKVRIALAPFAAGVNAGSYAVPATNKRGRDTCTFERSGADQSTDEAPGARGLSQDRRRSRCRRNPQQLPIRGRGRRPQRRRRHDQARDRSAARGGSTAGHLGTAWAWYLVSPKWATLWPASSRPVEYGDERTIKAVVLMTDGVYNTFGGACDRNCTNIIPASAPVPGCRRAVVQQHEGAQRQGVFDRLQVGRSARRERAARLRHLWGSPSIAPRAAKNCAGPSATSPRTCCGSGCRNRPVRPEGERASSRAAADGRGSPTGPARRYCAPQHHSSAQMSARALASRMGVFIDAGMQKPAAQP